jgi:hypothetical protein
MAVTSRLCALDYAGRGSERDHQCMSLIAYFREKAAHCRRLAENIAGDPTGEALLRLAEEFEAKAASYEAQKRATIPVDEETSVTRPTSKRTSTRNHH